MHFRTLDASGFLARCLGFARPDLGLLSAPFNSVSLSDPTLKDIIRAFVIRNLQHVIADYADTDVLQLFDQHQKCS